MKGARVAQVVYLLGTAVSGVVLVIGGLVTGDRVLIPLGLLIVGLSAVATGWYRR